MNTIEKQERQAKFMNLPFSYDLYEHPFRNIRILASDLKYSESWDWLMPLVCKITDLDNIDCMNKWQALTVDSEAVTLGMYSNDIEPVFNAADEFLAWYNEQNYVVNLGFIFRSQDLKHIKGYAVGCVIEKGNEDDDDIIATEDLYIVLLDGCDLGGDPIPLTYAIENVKEWEEADKKWD